MRTYSQCFVAARAVDWLVESFSMGRDEAVEFCQKLLDEGWMEGANNSASVFTDSAEEFFVWWIDRYN